MAISTLDGTKLGQTVVTDVNANVPAPPAKAQVLSREAALLYNKAVVARPLMTPEVCSIKVKNLEYQYRWANRDALGGRIYTQRRAQGFLNATNNDVEVLGGDVSDKDGEIRAGDLILMKIRTDLYDGAMKHNMLKALQLQNARGMWTEGGSSDVHSDETPKAKTVAAAGAPSFIPKAAEAEALINDSIHSG